MQGSYHDNLKKCDTLVLSAGHGDGDPGACYGAFKEADQAIFIVQRIMKKLVPVLPQGAVVAVPFRMGLKESVRWINNQWSPQSKTPSKACWAVEIHRDSAAPPPPEPALSRRCGIYHSGSTPSTQVANAFVADMIARGADKTTWSRSHKERGSLHWVAGINCLSHIVELGFMEGRNDDDHLTALADITAAALLKLFTGKA